MWQLLREWPPGYGGVERVAHELALAWQQQGQPSTIFSLVANAVAPVEPDPLLVAYSRVSLPRLALGRLLIPLPSRALLRLLWASDPLHAHLPCPAVLALALVARLLRPRRRISLHWHSFLEPASTPAGRFFGVYERLAELVLPYFAQIVTTSPVLRQDLIGLGVSPAAVRVLPCCIPESLERQAASISAARLLSPPRARPANASHLLSCFRLISIGRLDSYKRVDWLIEALATLQNLQIRLDVVGDGPDRGALEHQATLQVPGQVVFHGRLDEIAKQAVLARADLLVLAADRCNEAFGIVQLEAMACAVPAVALERPRSGMAWVGRTPALPWNGQRASLPYLIARLVADPVLLALVRREAQQRYLGTFSRRVWLQQHQQVFAR